MRSILKEIKLSSVLLLLLGSAILAFGLYNIHSMSNVTEGGILGLTLLLEYWFGISPSVSGFVLTILCYFLGWKLLGKRFLIYSFISYFSNSYPNLYFFYSFYYFSLLIFCPSPLPTTSGPGSSCFYPAQPCRAMGLRWGAG